MGFLSVLRAHITNLEPNLRAITNITIINIKKQTLATKELEYKKSTEPPTTLLFLNLDINPEALLDAPPRALPKLASGLLLLL